MARILIIDDSLLARRTHSMYVRELGHEVVTANNGLEGLALVEKEDFDLVLVDLMMPEMDGIGFLQSLKIKGIKLPVIVVSADIQETKRATCIELGARSFLGKPATMKKVGTLIDEILAA